MATDLLTIATSGTKAARAALDITAHNIANAATKGYARRTLDTREVAAPGSAYQRLDLSLAGVRVEGVARGGDAFRSTELRRSTSAAQAAGAELAALSAIEDALEQAGLFDHVVGFEVSLKALEGDPVSPSLRAAVIGAADVMASGFNVVARELDQTGLRLTGEGAAMTDDVNLFGEELARLNVRLIRAPDGGSERANLLDQRDQLLLELSERIDITATFGQGGTVAVRLGGADGPAFVNGATHSSLTAAFAADGSTTFAIEGDGFTPAGGRLAGTARAMAILSQQRTALDELALRIADTMSAGQANGARLDGGTGTPLFTATRAADISLAFQDGSLLATAPAGSPPKSRDPANLASLRALFDDAGHADAANTLLFAASSQVASRRITSEALTAIADADRAALDRQEGIDLDREAADLVRFQQAFEASGRAMQVATDIFDTLLGIGR